MTIPSLTTKIDQVSDNGWYARSILVRSLAKVVLGQIQIFKKSQLVDDERLVSVGCRCGKSCQIISAQVRVTEVPQAADRLGPPAPGEAVVAQREMRQFPEIGRVGGDAPRQQTAGKVQHPEERELADLGQEGAGQARVLGEVQTSQTRQVRQFYGECSQEIGTGCTRACKSK